jgi:RHS repeat-associated protein
MVSEQKKPLARYQYDALDRLTGHYQADRVVCQRFYCENLLSCETQGAVGRSIFQYEDRILAQHNHDNNLRESALMSTDLQCSILSLLNSQFPCSKGYSPYGYQPFAGGLSSLLSFTGQRPDPVTGHYLLGNGYRGFNSVLMRFNSPDNLSPFGKGGMNSYAYGLGDPINRIDPTGHISLSLISRIQAKYRSFRSGLHVKRQENPTQIAPGIFTYTDKYKGGRRVTFEAHGLPNVVQTSEGKFLGPEQLYNVAKKHGTHADRYDHVRLLTCHSAEPLNGEKYSFGEQFALISGRPVKAYYGKVLASASPVGQRFKGPFYLWMNKEKFGDGARFRSAIFRPEEIVREYAGIRK